MKMTLILRSKASSVLAFAVDDLLDKLVKGKQEMRNKCLSPSETLEIEAHVGTFTRCICLMITYGVEGKQGTGTQYAF